MNPYFPTSLKRLKQDADRVLQLPGREQYKHVIFAPALWSGYDEAFFPGVRDAVDDGEWKLAQGQLQKAADILMYASKKLLH